MEYSKVTSPIGELLIVASDRGLTQIAFESEGFEAVTSGIGLPKEESESQGANAQAARAHLLARAGQQLTEYFAGERREFDVPLDFTGRSGFQLDVQKYLAHIPYGTTQTYKQVAEALGKPGATRAVGSACGANPLPIVLPCHRVVRTDGGLGGYRGGLEAKRYLLDLERED